MKDSDLQSRSELLGQISQARSEQEISEAEQATIRYLDERPNDPDVLAASVRLDERAAEIRDPGRDLYRVQGKIFWVMTVLVATTTIVTLLSFILGSR